MADNTGLSADKIRKLLELERKDLERKQNRQARRKDRREIAAELKDYAVRKGWLVDGELTLPD